MGVEAGNRQLTVFTGEHMVERHSKNYVFWRWMNVQLKGTKLGCFTADCEIKAYEKLQSLPLELKERITQSSLNELATEFQRAYFPRILN